MTDFPTELKNEAYRVRMTEAERSRIRARVLGTTVHTPSPYTHLFSFVAYHRGLAIAFSFVLVLSGGAGGTLYAAEVALPGDALYPIKTGITEPLSGVFVVSKEAEAKWHASLAAKRLTEAEELAKEGRLTDENSAELAVAFAKHAEAIDDDREAEDSHGDEDGAERESSAREALNDLVATKSESILDTTDVDERRSQRVASAHFVLSVLGHDRTEHGGAEADIVPHEARMTKDVAALSNEPVTLMMRSSALAESTTEPAEEDMSDIAKRAKSAFQAARERISDDADRDSYRELSQILRILVRAQAESVAGDMVTARAGFSEVIERSNALSFKEDRTDVRGWMDSGHVRVRDLKNYEDDRGEQDDSDTRDSN